MEKRYAALKAERDEALKIAERHMDEADADGVTAERKDELYGLAERAVADADKLEKRMNTAQVVERAAERKDEVERASAPRPAVSGPVAARGEIKDMTANEIATRSQLLDAKLKGHMTQFNDEQKALMNRMPRGEQLFGLYLLSRERNSPWREDWDALPDDDKLAYRAYAGGQLTAPAADGGNLIPADWYGDIVSERKRIGPMFSNSVVNLRTKTVGTGELIVAYDSATKDWELVPVNEATDPAIQKGAFSQKKINVTKYSRRTPISYELTQDNPFAIRSWITEKIGDAVARGASKLFTTATGVPPAALQGIQAGVTAETATGGNTTLPKIDTFLDASGAVDESYLGSSRAYMMMNRAVSIALRKEKDSGLRLWSDSDMTSGIPAMLHGFPVIYNPDMASAATANAVLGMVGDFGQYWGVVDGTPRIMNRYDDDGDQYVVTLYIRLGGRVIDPTGLNKVVSK